MYPELAGKRSDAWALFKYKRSRNRQDAVYIVSVCSNFLARTFHRFDWVPSIYASQMSQMQQDAAPPSTLGSTASLEKSWPYPT